MPCFRHRSVAFSPASAAFNTRMICSSVNRLFLIASSRHCLCRRTHSIACPVSGEHVTRSPICTTMSWKRWCNGQRMSVAPEQRSSDECLGIRSAASRSEDSMVTVPWRRNWLKVTPAQFEAMTGEYLRGLKGEVKKFTVTRQAKLEGPDGAFVLDALVRFEEFGAEFLIVVECKHHKDPVKRELVQVLRDKVRSVNAQKAMMFSTGGFQKGAIAYARSQKIALIHCTAGG